MKIQLELLALLDANLVILFFYLIILDEWENPSGYNIDGDNTNATVTLSLRKCFKCTALGGIMEYCDRCSTTIKSGRGKETVKIIC